MTHGNYLLHRIDYSKHIRYMRHCHYLCFRRKHGLKPAYHKMTVIINRKHLKNSLPALAHHLPWNYVRMMLSFSYDDLITLTDESLAETECDQIYRSRRS